jgi:hypothetical protein
MNFWDQGKNDVLQKCITGKQRLITMFLIGSNITYEIDVVFAENILNLSVTYFIKHKCVQFMKCDILCFSYF